MSSGEARKFIVARLPSLRPGKLRLYDVKMALGSPFLTSSVLVHCLLECQLRFHNLVFWPQITHPMQGPQALASTVPPAVSNVLMVSSLSRVALICSLPGVMKKLALGFKPAAAACLTMSSERCMSW